MKNKIIPIFIPHQGCPQQCVFCNQSEITSAKTPTAADVTAEIEKALEFALNAQVAFYGGSFTAIDTALQESYLRAAFAFITAGKVASIRVSTRPDAISEPVLARLAKYGVETVELGAQSMDDAVLELSRRGHTSAQTAVAAKMIKDAGFELVLQVMCGLPGDSRELCRKTAEQVAALAPAAVRIYPVCVLKNTPLYEMAQSGEYTPLDIESAVEIAADMMEIFALAQIRAIRIGLNPSEELSAGAAAGGAYHPALGEMVYSRIWRRQAEKQIEQEIAAYKDIREISLHTPNNMMSKAHGQKNCNTVYFKKKYPDIHIIM